MYQRLQNLRQGTRTVNDYADEFYQLIARNDIMETEEQLTARYIGGLRMQIQDMVNMFNPISVAEAHQKALAWEKQGRRGSGVFVGSNSQSKGASSSLMFPRQSVNQLSKKPLKQRSTTVSSAIIVRSLAIKVMNVQSQRREH